jgi:hypothetical protein
MAGTSYTRQSTLTDGSLITAALFNDEYNQILNAFVYSSTGTTGHTHDGSAGQGGAIAKIGDQDFKNKIEISSTNNRIECYIEVSGSPVEQLRIQDGAILPVTDSDIDLGTTSLRFKDAFVDSLTVTGVVTATGFTIGSAVITEAELEILDGKTFLDEDDLVSDSATGIPSQQSVKAYVDAQVTAQDLDLTDGTTSISIDLDSEALSVLGGTGITSTASGNGVTLAIDSTVATLTGTQTLTNKTLTSPDVNGGTIDGAVIGGTAAAAGSFTTIDATGNITVGGTVDGRDVAADGTKLDGIETAATADQTASEIRALVEAATDSNVFTDADHGKLNGIEASATADQTDAEIRAAVEAATDSNVFTDADHSKLNAIEASADVTDTTNVTAAGALMDSEVTNLAQVKAFDSSDYATAAQGTTAEDALPKSGGAMTGAITTNSTFDGRDVATDGTKLDGIEASADVTDTTNVTAAGALMDSELTAIASVKALNQGVATTDSPSFVNLTLSGTGSVKVPSGTTAQRDGSPVNGMFRYNSSNEQFEGYQSGDWGAIGGGGGSNTFTADTFTANGSTTAYALSQVINSENNLLVFIDGVFQQQSAYSIATASGTTTLTFSTAPANTREIIVYSVASAVSGSNLNTDSMTGDGSDVTLALSIAPVSENNTQVFIDGVYQNKDTYSISGTTLTFSTAPPTGSAVEVMTMTQTEVNVPVDGTITSAKLSGDLTLPGDLSFADNSKAIFGAGSDLQIYHDGSASFISDQGTGHLKLLAGDFRLNSAADDSQMISAVSGAEVNVFHNNALKLATTSTGIDVTGTATMDGVLSNGGGINDIPLEITHSWGASGTPLIKASNASSEVFRVQRNGLVGIGTSSPDQLLQLGSETYGANAIIKTQVDGSDAGDFDAGLHMRSHNDDFGGSIVLESRSSTNDIINFKYHNNSSAGVSAMAIDATNGNVGIGFTSPQAKLQVLDQLKVSTADQSQGVVALGDGSSTQFGVGIARWNGSSNSGGAGGLGYFSQGTVNSGGHFFYTGDAAAGSTTERMRIDSSGLLKIGTSSTVAPYSLSKFAIDTGTYSFMDLLSTGSSGINFGDAGGAQRGSIEYNHGSDYLRFGTAGSERMRIDSSGNLLVGCTSPLSFGSGTTEGVVIERNALVASRANVPALFLQRSGSDGQIANFYRDTSSVGNISVTGTATTYNTSSDQRLKENIADADDAGSKVDAIQVRQYDWKADGSHQDYGMIAQELQAVAPEAVSGDADSEDMMGVDYSKLVPMLVKEIQSLRNRVAQLEE